MKIIKYWHTVRLIFPRIFYGKKLKNLSHARK